MPPHSYGPCCHVAPDFRAAGAEPWEPTALADTPNVPPRTFAVQTKFHLVASHCGLPSSLKMPHTCYQKRRGARIQVNSPSQECALTFQTLAKSSKLRDPCRRRRPEGAVPSTGPRPVADHTDRADRGPGTFPAAGPRHLHREARGRKSRRASLGHHKVSERRIAICCCTCPEYFVRLVMS